MTFQILQPLFEQLYSLIQLAPVQFQLRLTRAARADSIFLLPHIRIHADQARRKILELSQLYLHLTFMALRA